MEQNILRSQVYGKYRSIADLARVLGWTRQKATDIINHTREPSLKDVEDLSKALDMQLQEVADIFLP